MPLEMILVMLLIGMAVVLFTWDMIPAEVVALGLMLSFVLTGLLTPDQAFSGFASDTVMMILGLLIMTSAIATTGILSGFSRWVQVKTVGRPWLFVFVLLLLIGTISSFISNTASTALLVPMAIAVCQRMNLSTSRVLLPMAFVSILAGTVTLIGTSTNLVVSGLMKNLGMAPLDMFEITPVGLTILAIGFIYIFFIGRYLIPDRSANQSQEDVIRRSTYLTEVAILKDSPLHGKTLRELKFYDQHDLQVIRIIRQNSDFLPARSDTPLLSGDILLVEGTREAILEVKEQDGIEIKTAGKWSSLPATRESGGSSGFTQFPLAFSNLAAKSPPSTLWSHRLGVAPSWRHPSKKNQRSTITSGRSLASAGPGAESPGYGRRRRPQTFG
jgi:di/tricarboxylate transporter